MKTTIEKSSTGIRRWVAYDDKGQQVASIMLSHDGEVEWVGTRKGHERQGLATALWKHLVATGEKPRHSACRWPAGDRWARKVGGDLPPIHTLPCAKCGTV